MQKHPAEAIKRWKKKPHASSQVIAFCYLLGLFALDRLKGWWAAHEWSRMRETDGGLFAAHSSQTPSCQVACLTTSCELCHRRFFSLCLNQKSRKISELCFWILLILAYIWIIDEWSQRALSGSERLCIKARCSVFVKRGRYTHSFKWKRH